MIRASAKSLPAPDRADAATMRHAFLVACALWITTAIALFLLVLSCLQPAIQNMWPFPALAAGFCLSQAIRSTQLYRSGQR